MTREIADEEVVTQYGNSQTDPVFRTRPDPESPTPRAMSATVGRLTPAAIAKLVRGYERPAGDLARYARVGDLRQAGFEVRHTPSNRNPGHVSIEWPADWDDTVAERFDRCYGESNG